MTSQSLLLVFVLAICSLDEISGASFSNVIVQRGSDVLPLEYINYNPSALTYTSQVARLSQAPLQSVISEPLATSVLSPCVSPCVIPNVAPIHSTPNAKIITYKASAPSVPVILTNKDEARGYQYAYAVFDEDTGDKKTQSEHSDGSVVQGHYSFIQPDGFVREVVYTADDLKGFNAVVRNISPGPDHKHHAETEKKPNVPCNNAKNEHLTHKHESHEEGSSEVIPVKQEHLEVEHLQEKKVEVVSAEKVNEHSGENSAEKLEDKSHENKSHEDKSHEDKSHEDKSHEDKPHGEVHHEEAHHEEAHHEEAHHEEAHHEEPHHEETHHEEAHHEEAHHEEGHNEEDHHEEGHHEDSHHEEGHHEEVHPVVESEDHEPNALISYSDILKCLQSKLHGSQTAVSPLTYVLLPSSYKPC